MAHVSSSRRSRQPNEEEKAAVVQEIESSASQLMRDLFGNYVVQKLFKFGNAHQMELLLQHLKGNS